MSVLEWVKRYPLSILGVTMYIALLVNRVLTMGLLPPINIALSLLLLPMLFMFDYFNNHKSELAPLPVVFMIALLVIGIFLPVLEKEAEDRAFTESLRREVSGSIILETAILLAVCNETVNYTIRDTKITIAGNEALGIAFIIVNHRNKTETLYIVHGNTIETFLQISPEFKVINKHLLTILNAAEIKYPMGWG